MYQTIILNFMYASVGLILGLFFCFVGFKIFDKITPFNTEKQLKEGNIAVAIVTGSIFISIGIMVANIIGMALN